MERRRQDVVRTGTRSFVGHGRRARRPSDLSRLRTEARRDRRGDATEVEGRQLGGLPRRSAVRLIFGPLLPRTGYKQAAVPLCSGSAYPTDSRSPTTVPCHVPAPISSIAADTSSGVSITIVIKQPAVMPRPVPSAEPGGTGRRRTSEGSVAPWAGDLARPRHVFRVMLVTPASPDP